MVEGYEVYVMMPCGVARSPLPTKNCQQPYIVINRTSTGLNYFNLVAGKVSIGDTWMFDGNDDPMKKVPISAGMFGAPERSQELFDLLMSAPDTRITFKTRSGTGAPITIRTVVLADFVASASEEIQDTHRNFDRAQATERRDMLFATSLLIGTLALGLWLVIYLFKRGRARLLVTKQKLEMKRVARIAEDEAIRESVRGSVQKADERELGALRSQIKVALDAGDTDAAETLLNILKKNSV